MTNISKKQDLSVELLRIIACLMVIMIHVRPFPFSGDNLRDAVILIYVLNGPAVASFLLISGFFISKKQSLIHVWLRFLKGIILPAAVFVFVLGMIRTWIDHPEISILTSISLANPLKALTDMAQGFLAFDTVRFGIYADHLWYIFSHAEIMLWMTVILPLVRHDEQNMLKLLLAFAAIHFTLQNLSALVILPFSLYTFPAIGKPSMYAIAGYLFYSWVKRIREPDNRSAIQTSNHSDINSVSSMGTDAGLNIHVHNPAVYTFIFFLVFLTSSVFLFMLQKHIYVAGLMSGRSPSDLNTDYYFTSWNGMICALQTISLSGMVLLLPTQKWNSMIRTAIKSFGGCTFHIYLIHYIFTNHFRAIGLEGIVRNLFGESSQGLILYTLMYSIFVFMFSASLIFIYRKLWKTILCLFQKK
ncbi:acyltransferase family protein [Oribacterium sp. WCC10]|uniref:acyltransferase family protein n=1 Tax=Oribacterium sp. WCC10 TaxID=1855343 RepID=UPI0008DFDC51|nr:acyltransferase family protein [Oribacterium sp. WCC10]SFG40210.1 Acyltransferase family protein [Oribacterium sp. WCC10]